MFLMNTIKIFRDLFKDFASNEQGDYHLINKHNVKITYKHS